MFLFLSKVLDWLLAPLSWSLVLLALAALLRRRLRRAWVLVAIALANLVLFSSDRVANLLQRIGERGVHSTYRPDVVYDAVVVLGGMVNPATSRASGETEIDVAANRILRAYELVRSGRARNVLISGGEVDRPPGDPSEAERLAAKLVEWGVPQDQVVVEPSSRNTRENAIESTRIAASRGWKTLLLVTSAIHAPRALGCFRALGVEPDVLPVDHRVRDSKLVWLPRAAALSRSTDALRELAGRAVYRAMGYAR